MQIVADALITHPLPLVFATYRDEMPNLVEFLPNIREIRVISRVERPNEVELVNEWVGGGDIPAAARAFLKESMLRWTDYATWFNAEHRVAWRTDVHAFPGAIKSSGTNRFVEVSEGTRLEVRGELVCDATKVPGVPRLLAGSVGVTVAKILVAQVVKNTTEIGRGVSKGLSQTKA